MLSLRRAAAAAVLTVVAVLGPGACASSDGEAPGDGRSLILATTTSTQDSGLLDELLPAFTADTGWQVKTLAVGSGQALELGRRGEADVLLVHSPEAEQAFMAEGLAGPRRPVMYNDFVLLGPAADPAQARGRPIAEAMAGIAGTSAPFASRGDESGTHAREKQLWADAGITPGGPWYQVTGQGMGATLQVADEKAAYTLADRATFLSQENLDLELLVEGDDGLLNRYHVIEMTTRAGPRVEVAGAAAFADWIISAPAQRLIGEFGLQRFGQALFTPDASGATASPSPSPSPTPAP